MTLSRHFRVFALLCATVVAGALGAPRAAGSTESASPAPAVLSPRETLERFDSLVTAGDLDAARALCTGQALRLFPLLAEAHQALAGFLDTAQSRDTVIGEARAGSWVALKVRSEAVFVRPLMGMDRMEAVQAVHLFGSDSTGWKIADFEELPGEDAPLAPRAGVPSVEGLDAPALPVSRLAPEDGVRPASLTLRVSLRSGDSLPPLPLGPGQRLLKNDRAWAEVETLIPPLPDSLHVPEWGASRDSVHLASTPDLDLSDPVLRRLADSLRRGAAHDLDIVRRIHAHLVEAFDYQLGVSLFGTSREAVRDMEGDCSEAAVLTAALLRASGIPSRVVLGFATLGRGVFIGHAWAEAKLAGEWIGVDAALREFPAGAERLALKTLSGERPMQTEATNVMLRMLANLDIQITAAHDAGGEPLELREFEGSDAAVGEFWDSVLEGMRR